MISLYCFNLSPLSMAQILIASLLAICFLQSGIDKIIDRKGNLAWLMGHFSNTPFKNIVPLLLMIITLLELLGGLFCAVGIFYFLIILNSVLLFSALPVSEVLFVIGNCSPKPLYESLSLATPLDKIRLNTAFALFSEST